MRDPIENISALQKKINQLQLENQLLKNILHKAGISYKQEISHSRQAENTEAYDPDQGSRITHPTTLSKEMLEEFRNRFYGRTDVYAKRGEKHTGEAGYYPQCDFFWTEVCHRKKKDNIPCNKCNYQKHTRLDWPVIIDHLLGRSRKATDVIGVYPLLPDGTCRFLVFDFDNHDGDAEKRDYANVDDVWIEEVEAMRDICILNGIDPLVERSRSGKGAHIWIFFEGAVKASLARKFGNTLLNKGAEQVNLRSFKYYDRMLPAQDSLPEGAIGNLIALPLQGKALREGNSAFVDKNWNAYPDQWDILCRKPRLSQEFLELKIREWDPSAIDKSEEVDEAVREKPWKVNGRFSPGDVDGIIRITLSNGIYVDSLNLKPGIQNKIRRKAAFGNPKYYQNQAIELSNFDTSRLIYLGRDHLNGYIEIPRGLYDGLIDDISKAGIPFEVEDERESGRPINVMFKGELREEQKPALEELIKHDNGILHAATAFGKTVVCSAIIAEKKVNTLIILQSSSLMEQWMNALEKFLDIDEQLPTYKTKTGREKTRKSLIGRLQASHDSTTGIIDIAMVGSICKKGEFHPRLKQYGMILVDECHHAAADTFSEVLREVRAKYVYGVTATPKRADGLEKINTMLLGPIRYRYTSKDKAKAQGIGHYVYPRFTRVVPPRGITEEKMHPNEAYDILHSNIMRDEIIIQDIKECVASGRTPVVLSRYKDHSERLYDRVKDFADHVFLMTGNNSKREHKRILEQMNLVKETETLILVATGKLIGEGFDYPRLDTLFMAMPVSFRSVVEQYAGRLNRDYKGKADVIVYDYVDSHIPMFDNMYAKRLRAYKQIGYEVCGGIEGEKQTANAIFDHDTYTEVFQRDILEAENNIIISSPAINGKKVDALIRLVSEKQKRGVSVTVITWEPDSYGYGDAAYWMQLHEEMRQAGFYMKTVDDYCERFSVIDQEIVWYGNINLLANSGDDSSMMRISDKKAAEELIEMAFGLDTKR